MIKIIDDYIACCKGKSLIYAMTRRTETFIAPYVYFTYVFRSSRAKEYERIFFLLIFVFIFIFLLNFTEHLSVQLPPTVVLFYNYLLFIYLKINSK